MRRKNPLEAAIPYALQDAKSVTQRSIKRLQAVRKGKQGILSAGWEGMKDGVGSPYRVLSKLGAGALKTLRNPVSSYRGVPFTLQAGVYRLHLPTGTEAYGHSRGGKGAMQARVDGLLARRVANPKKQPTKRKPMQVQEFRFLKSTWSPSRITSWLKKNHHKVATVHSGDTAFHVQQHPPTDYQKGTLHTVYVAKHVEAVVGIPKSISDAASVKGYGTRGARQGQLFSRVSAPAVKATRPDDVMW